LIILAFAVFGRGATSAAVASATPATGEAAG
jgi:hypothetical protein